MLSSAIFVAGLYKAGSPVKLFRNEADLAYGADHTVVEFFAPWCGHCQRFAPAYESAAEQLTTEHVPSLTVAAVDCAAEPELCGTYSVSSYPTIILLPEKRQYDGAKEAEPLVAWVRKQLASFYPADAAAEAVPSVDLPPLARRPHTGTVAAADVLAAARHSLSHVVAAALPVHQGEGGDLDEQGLLQLMQGDDTGDEEGGGGTGGGGGGGRGRGHGGGHAGGASATNEVEFLPSRPEASWGDSRRRALLNWLTALEAPG